MLCELPAPGRQFPALMYQNRILRDLFHVFSKLSFFSLSPRNRFFRDLFHVFRKIFKKFFSLFHRNRFFRDLFLVFRNFFQIYFRRNKTPPGGGGVFRMMFLPEEPDRAGKAGGEAFRLKSAFGFIRRFRRPKTIYLQMIHK